MAIREAGFSVVELLATMSIVLVLSAASFPMVTTSLNTYRLRNDTRRIAAQSQNAKFLAISSNTSHRLHRNENTIELQRRTGGGYTTVDSFQLAPGISIVQAWSADPVFSPRGTVSPSATIILANRDGIQRTVSISVLGRVSEQ